MHIQHLPRIDRRYWCAILCASIFGTNLGDLYAHASGLGLGAGLLLLTALFAAAYWVEARDRLPREIYYWLAIIIIRTGATNIADYLAYRVRIPAPMLVGGLAAAIALLAWLSAARTAQTRAADPALARTSLAYWGAMLGAGVFGTVAGDICAHYAGLPLSSVALTGVLALVLGTSSGRAASQLPLYWCAIGIARTAGTCIGDFLAESRGLHIGLPLSSALTGALFLAVLTLWRPSQPAARAVA